MTWAKIRDPEKLEDEANEETNKVNKPEEVQYEYTTECPIFESEKFNPLVTPVPTGTGKTKVIYSLNWNTYDKGYKPYYPSMDPNALGGELKFKSKKNLKSEDRGKHIVGSGNNNLNSAGGSLKMLMEAYGDDEQK